MKNELDIITVNPKVTRKISELAEWMFGDSPVRTPKAVFISKNFTREQLANALALITAIHDLTGVTLDEMDVLGKSNDEIQTVYNTKCAARNRRAGVRALVHKYGHDSAERIVRNHSGRTIK